MTTSQKKSILSEIEGNDPLSKGTLAYLCERVRNEYYDYVLTKFYEAAKTEGLTQAQLARRLGLGPDRISKLLGTPGNWTIDTVTELLVAIAREELQPYSVPYSGREKRNMKASDNLDVVKIESEKGNHQHTSSASSSSAGAYEVEVP